MEEIERTAGVRAESRERRLALLECDASDRRRERFRADIVELFGVVDSESHNQIHPIRQYATERRSQRVVLRTISSQQQQHSAYECLHVCFRV